MRKPARFFFRLFLCSAAIPPLVSACTQGDIFTSPAPRLNVLSSLLGPIETKAVPVPPITADRLVSVSAVELEDAFGEAELIRKEGVNQVWQYRSGACVLDVYLVSPYTGKPPDVAYVETRTLQNAEINLEDCLNSFAVLPKS